MKRSDMEDILVKEFEKLIGRRMDGNSFPYKIANIFLDTVEKHGMLPPLIDSDNKNWLKYVEDADEKYGVFDWEDEYAA